MLVGGGFAMAEGAGKSCLSAWLGARLNGVTRGGSPLALAAAAAGATSLVTEVMSNTATANVLLPVLARLAADAGVNPLYVMMPSAFGEIGYWFRESYGLL